MTTTRMLYIDDSGSAESGWIVYGWIECRLPRWPHALRALLEMRKAVYRAHGVPPAQELHATKFVNGRSQLLGPREKRDTTEWKTLGRAVARQCLQALADCNDIMIGAVYRRTAAKGGDYHHERGEVYAHLLEELNVQHRAQGSFVFIGMDGDGSDPTYYAAHRTLPLESRHVIEDPMFHDSRRSQPMQMADLVAYTVFCHLNRHGGNEFAWGWYEQYLAASDSQGAPRPV